MCIVSTVRCELHGALNLELKLNLLFLGVDPDSEVVVFAKRTVKDLKLPPAFITQIAQSIQVSILFTQLSWISFPDERPIKRNIMNYFWNCLLFQSQLTDFRSYEGQDMYAGEKIVPIKVCFCKYIHP